MAYFEVKSKPRLTFPTLTDSIVTFNSQYAGLPLKSHSVKVVATQSGSGTPSPSNPRPITGYSAINISHSDADTSNPTVYTINLGSTVYGGEYDARTGLFTVTWVGVDMGSLSWSLPGSYFITNSVRTDILSPVDGNTLPEVMCDIYNPITWNQSANYAVQIGPQSYSQYVGQVWIKNNDYTSAADFKTAMSGHYLVYKLATPTTIQLPPCPIDTLLGENNIWADTGDTTLQYIKLG